MTENRAEAVCMLRWRIAQEGLNRVSGLRSLLRAALLVAPAAVAAFTVVQFGSSWLWVLYLFVATAVLCTLPALYHEATHGSVSRNRLVNDTVGTIAAALHGVPFGTWRYFHLAHHAKTGTAEDSENYPTCWSRWTLLTFPLTQWVFLTILWRWTWGTARGSGPRWIRSARQRKVVSTNAACTLSIWAAEAGACLVWPWLLAALVAPCALSVMVASLTLVPEHFPAYRIGPGESDQLDRTGTFHSNPVLRLILWNSNFHAAHHFAPKVPAHRLPAVDLMVSAIQPTAWRWRGYARWYRERLRELSWSRVDLSVGRDDAVGLGQSYQPRF